MRICFEIILPLIDEAEGGGADPDVVAEMSVKRYAAGCHRGSSGEYVIYEEDMFWMIPGFPVIGFFFTQEAGAYRKCVLDICGFLLDGENCLGASALDPGQYVCP